jgi:hypothetical protein
MLNKDKSYVIEDKDSIFTSARYADLTTQTPESREHSKSGTSVDSNSSCVKVFHYIEYSIMGLGSLALEEHESIRLTPAPVCQTGLALTLPLLHIRFNSSNKSS